ncbi:MAG TPA: hypothetical protein VFB16_09285 [Bauldia sp.]|nr:hypothetical protein [Bauldia sp.]
MPGSDRAEPAALKTVAVVASNRGDSLTAFLAAWSPAPWSEMVVVEDGPRKTFDLGRPGVPLHHVAWDDIAAEAAVGRPDPFSRRDSAIKLFGFWLAATRLGADIVIGLDDDCLPVGEPAGFVAAHLSALAPRPRWVPSHDDLPTRGLPYYDLGTMEGAVANMGLWQGIADHDAPQTLALRRLGLSGHDHRPGAGSRLMHPRQYWPWCAMNIAFRAEVLPLLYMPKMGEGSPYRRFDDIWSGIILQRCCRHLGLLLSAGDPHIRHNRASDPMANLEKEAPGIRANEDFWKVVDAVPLTEMETDPLACMEAVASHFAVAGRDRTLAGRNAVLAAYLAEEADRIRSWCGMFRGPGASGRSPA